MSRGRPDACEEARGPARAASPNGRRGVSRRSGHEAGGIVPGRNDARHRRAGVRGRRTGRPPAPLPGNAPRESRAGNTGRHSGGETRDGSHRPRRAPETGLRRRGCGTPRPSHPPRPLENAARRSAAAGRRRFGRTSRRRRQIFPFARARAAMVHESVTAAILFADVCGSTRLHGVVGNAEAPTLIGETLARLTEVTARHQGSGMGIRPTSPGQRPSAWTCPLIPPARTPVPRTRSGRHARGGNRSPVTSRAAPRACAIAARAGPQNTETEPPRSRRDLGSEGRSGTGPLSRRRRGPGAEGVFPRAIREVPHDPVDHRRSARKETTGMFAPFAGWTRQ